MARGWSVLDADERTRADGLLQESDRRAYVVSHALLRCVLARAIGDSDAARALRFARTAHGRPELLGRDGQHAPTSRFSLSHTRALVGCAVARISELGRPAAADIALDLGFDLEEARVPAPLDVASRYFTPVELAGIRALPPAREHQRFYALWTLKEAYIKGRGLGLTLPLDSFTVEPLARGRARLVVHRAPECDGAPEDGAPWTLRWWRVGEHQAALAVRWPADRTRVQVHAGLRLGALPRRAS